MAQVIKAKITPNYETLKAAFRDGIEYRRCPASVYLENHPFKPDMRDINFNLMNVIKDLKLVNDKSKETNKIHELITKMKNLLNKTATIEVDWQSLVDIVTKPAGIQEVLQKGYSMLADTFNEGIENPEECIKAWYDALAERAIAVARFYQGTKPPIFAIREDSDALSDSLKTNTEFREAKKAVFEQMRKLNPKTYKKFIASCEEKYDKEVQAVIDDIVRDSVREGYTFIYPKKQSSKVVHKA